MTKQILDIYSGNRIDVEREVATRTDAVIVKAGQGQNWNYLRASQPTVNEFQALGIPVQYYWLVDARYSPESQKAAIKAAFPVDKWSGKLRLWLDCEKPVLSMPDWLYHKQKYAYAGPIESVAQMLLASYGPQSVGIYTSPGAYRLIFGGASEARQKWFAQFPLWTAQYKVGKPDVYGYWSKWLMWQYQESPDYSVWSGTDEEFDAFFGGAPAVQPVPIDVTVDIRFPSRIEDHFFPAVRGVTITTNAGDVVRF